MFKNVASLKHVEKRAVTYTAPCAELQGRNMWTLASYSRGPGIV